MLTELKGKELSVMAPVLLSWNFDLKSDSADYNREIIQNAVKEVSEGNDARSRTTLKDKFTSSIVSDTYNLCDIKVTSPSLQICAISVQHIKQAIVFLISYEY